MQRLIGMTVGYNGGVITSVPCGHSRCPDCFGRRLAEATATECGLLYRQLWADRALSGKSHPKECKRTPPLTWLAEPDQLVIVVDDLVTFGWHIEEAVRAVRSKGLPAIGVVWLDNTGSQADGYPA